MLTCLKFCLSTSLWHFPFPTTFRHLTSTRLSPELQSDYNIVGLFAISKACTHKRTKLDFFKQEDILVINRSLLFCIDQNPNQKTVLFPGSFSSEICTSKPQGGSLKWFRENCDIENQCYLKTSLDSIMLADALWKERCSRFGGQTK